MSTEGIRNAINLAVEMINEAGSPPGCRGGPMTLEHFNNILGLGVFVTCFVFLAVTSMLLVIAVSELIRFFSEEDQ